MENIECDSKVKDVASKFKEYKAEIEECKNDLDKELGSISEAWQGADATRYVDKMKDDFLFSFGGLFAGFDECINFLEKNVPVKYKEDDEEFAGREAA